MQEQINTPSYKGYERRGLSEHKQRHVNDHLTPLAAIIVIPGLFVADLSTFDTVLGAILIFLSVATNYSLRYMAKAEKARFFGSIRVCANYAFNVILLWLLYTAWPPVWLLLFLMSIGVAIYQRRKDSFLTSIAFSIMLIIVHFVFGEQSLQAWTEIGVMVSMMVLMNLYVNGLVKQPGTIGSGVLGVNQAQDSNQVQDANQTQGVQTQGVDQVLGVDQGAQSQV